MFDHSFGGIAPVNELTARERFEHKTTEGVDIGSSVHSLAHALFRAHIDGGAENLTGFGEGMGFSPGALDKLGNSEVHQFDLGILNITAALNQHDIAWFHVAVHNPFGMGMAKSATDL